MRNKKEEGVAILVACLFKKGQPESDRESLCEQLVMFASSVQRYACNSTLYIYTNNKELVERRLKHLSTKSGALRLVLLNVLPENSAVNLMVGCSNQYTFAKIDALRALSLRREIESRILVSDIDAIVGPSFNSLREYNKPTAIDYFNEHDHAQTDFAEALDLIASDETYNKKYWISKKVRINSGYMYMDKDFFKYVVNNSWELCLNMHKGKEQIEEKANHFGDELIFSVMYQMYDTNIMVHASKMCDAAIFWTCHIRHRKCLVLPPVNKIKHIHLPALKWQHKIRRLVLRILGAESINDYCSWKAIYMLLNLVAIYQQLSSEARRITVTCLNLKKRGIYHET